MYVGNCIVYYTRHYYLFVHHTTSISAPKHEHYTRQPHSSLDAKETDYCVVMTQFMSGILYCSRDCIADVCVKVK